MGVHGEVSLCVCDLNYRNEAAQMMVRSEAALMSGSGKKDSSECKAMLIMAKRDERKRSFGGG
jgi:hypothetical protein